MLGAAAGAAVALIFYLRMRVEEMAGKAATRQASLGGFETEDVLYLLPVVTLCNGIMPFLIAASIGAPLFAVWVVIDYRRGAPIEADGGGPVGDGTGLTGLPRGITLEPLRRAFVEQGSFLFLPEFLPRGVHGAPRIGRRRPASIGQSQLSARPQTGGQRRPARHR